MYKGIWMGGKSTGFVWRRNQSQMIQMIESYKLYQYHRISSYHDESKINILYHVMSACLREGVSSSAPSYVSSCHWILLWHQPRGLETSHGCKNWCQKRITVFVQHWVIHSHAKKNPIIPSSQRLFIFCTVKRWMEAPLGSVWLIFALLWSCKEHLLEHGETPCSKFSSSDGRRPSCNERCDVLMRWHQKSWGWGWCSWCVGCRQNQIQYIS